MTWNELLFDFVTLWVTVDPMAAVSVQMVYSALHGKLGPG